MQTCDSCGGRRTRLFAYLHENSVYSNGHARPRDCRDHLPKTPTGYAPTLQLQPSRCIARLSEQQAASEQYAFWG